MRTAVSPHSALYTAVSHSSMHRFDWWGVTAVSQPSPYLPIIPTAVFLPTILNLQTCHHVMLRSSEASPSSKMSEATAVSPHSALNTAVPSFIHAPVCLAGRRPFPPLRTLHSPLRTQHGRFPQFCQAINGKKIIPLPILELAGISFREYKIPLAVAVHLNGVAHPEYSFCFWLQ